MSLAQTKIEKYTEKLTEQEMRILQYGENPFGYVYVQGELTPNSDINSCLLYTSDPMLTATIGDYRSKTNFCDADYAD